MNEIVHLPPRRRRRWPIVLLLVLVLLGIAGGLGWRYRVPVASQAAAMALEAFGMDAAMDFRVAAVEASRVRLEDLRFGESGPTAEAAEMAFTADDLAEGRIRSLHIFGASLTLAQTEDGAFAIQGMPDFSGGDESEARPSVPAADAFPALPDVARIQFTDARLTVIGSDLNAAGRADLTLERTAPGRYRLTADATAESETGARLTLNSAGSEIAYSPERVRIVGPLSLAYEDAAADAKVALWTDAALAPDGGVVADGMIASANGAYQDKLKVGAARGRFAVALAAAGRPQARLDLQASDIAVAAGRADHAVIVAETQHGALSLTVDAVGPDGNLSAAVDLPQTRDKLAATVHGDLDAALIAGQFPDVVAHGRVRFAADAAADGAVFLNGFDYRSFSGGGALTVETPFLSIPNVAPEGAASGQLDIAIGGGAATLTSPGFWLSGVALPPELLAAAPPDIRRAFAEPAFLRFGGAGLSGTAITVSERPEGGYAAVGAAGVAVSNPNLALFIEGDAAVSTTAAGALEAIDSENLSVRVVDAALGPARVSGLMQLTGLTGDADALSAEAALSLGADLNAKGYRVRGAEIDIAGPLKVTPAAAALTPKPGGRIRLGKYAGPLMETLRPIRLALAKRGAHRVVYDRIADNLDVRLNFLGFKTQAALAAQEGEEPAKFDLRLGGIGVRHGPKGSSLTLRNGSGRFPDYQIAVEGGDARIALGAKQAQSGRLTIKRIRHLAPSPLWRPLSMRLDVSGRGDRLTFEGALIAAGERARLSMTGRHNLATGVGDARLNLGPVVFAPGVLQPQDFVPPLYRILLDTIGETQTEAAIGWGPDGLTGQNATVNLVIDKLETSEVSLERMATTFRFDRLFPPRSAGPQRLRVGRLNVGVPMTLGAMQVNLISPERIEVTLDRFEMFGGLIKSQKLTIDPTRESFDAVLEVSDIDLASILAFAEFGELHATGKLEGKIPIRFDKGELRIDGGLLRTGAGGGRLRYRPREIDKALSENDRSSKLAIQALSNFAYDEISIQINELEAEELRLDIHIAGTSLDLYDGVPFEFNIVVEGPLRQIIQENLAPPELPPEVLQLLERNRQPSQ